MKIKLSDHFTYRKLLAFTLPSIVMMVFNSIYGIVDGYFISNFAGKDAFAAINFIMPFLMILGTIGFMFGSGGSALIAKNLGEKNPKKANDIFSMLVYLTLILGVVFAVVGIFLIEPVARAMGADDKMVDGCLKYGRIILLALPFFMTSGEFQAYFPTAEKPKMGLLCTVICGVLNMVLDALFVAVFKWGIVGAAVATAIAQALGGLIPLLYFALPNSSILRLGKLRFDFRALLKSCTNGASEFMSNISLSVVGMLYNIQLLKYAGADGVSAYGVLMYVCFIFIAAFIGYSMGQAPIVGYHYGAQNHDEMHNLLRKSMVIVGITSIGMFIFSITTCPIFARLYVGYDKALYELTLQGFYIMSWCFLVCGFSIYISSFFTALNNGLISAIVSFMRTFFFQVICVLVLPIFFKVSGIWWSMPLADLLSTVFAVSFLLYNRKKYKY